MFKNAIGLEAEFFVRNAKGELVLPGEHGLPHDDFPLLGEIRAKPAETRADVIGNFFREYHGVLHLAKQKGLTLDIAAGWQKLEPKFHSSVVRKMGTKLVAKCANVYDHDILNYSDEIIEGGRKTAHKVSAGLHVHFSSLVTEEKTFVQKEYERLNLPLKATGLNLTLDVFAPREEKKTVVKCSGSRITKPVILYLVKGMDENVLTKYKIDEPLKYRVPGFYESKADGRVEYRSLPFNAKVLDGIADIVDYAFSLLEAL